MQLYRNYRAGRGVAHRALITVMSTGYITWGWNEYTILDSMYWTLPAPYTGVPIEPTETLAKLWVMK